MHYRMSELVNHYRSRALSGQIENYEGIVPTWHHTGYIQINAQSGIDGEIVNLVKRAIEDRIKQIFGEINRFGVFVSQQNIDAYVRSFLDSKGGLREHDIVIDNYRRLAKQQKPRASVFIVDHHFKDDAASWGRATFWDGCMILTLPGDRQDEPYFLSSLAKHETDHLLGLGWHCDDARDVDNYVYSPQCNNHWHVPTPQLCKKCKDYIRLWWQGLPK